MRRWTVFASAVLVSASLFAADWPQFRGPDHNGISPETNLNLHWQANTPRELWRINLGDNGYSGPAVAEGKLFITDHEGTQDVVRAVDLRTGQDVWTFKYEGPAQPLGGYGFSRPTATIADGRVYQQSAHGKLHCLDARTGKLIWKKDLVADLKGKAPRWGFAASPFFHKGKLIVCPGGQGGAAVALDAKSGNLLWKAGTDGAGYSTPVFGVLNGVEQYVVFSESSIGGYGVADGKLLWSHPWKTNYGVNAASPLILDNAVFISSGYNTGCAVLDITPAGPKVRWQSKVIQQHFASGVLVNGMIYATTDPGDLVCVEFATGKEAWRSGGFEKGGIVAVEGAIIGTNGRGGDVILVALKPESYQELGRIKPLNGQSWTAPIVADGKLFVRDLKSLVCLDLTR